MFRPSEETTDSATVRVVRAAVFGVVAVVAAAAAHRASHHSLPPLHVLVIATLVCAGLVAATPLRERGFAAIAAAMVTVQAVMHTSFALTGGMANGAGHPRAASGPLGYLLNCASSGGRHPGDLAAWLSAHGGTLGGTPDGGNVGASGPLASLASLVPFSGGPAMISAHLVAALVLVGWLRAGEAALWRLVRLAARRAAVWCTAWIRSWDLPALDHLRMSAPLPALAHARLCSLRHAVSRRGPPTAFACS